MSQYKITVWAESNLQGGSWEETIDLVEDFGLSEEQAANYIAIGCYGDDAIDAMVREQAIEQSGFSFGACVSDEEDL